MYKIRPSSRFQRDLKKIKKRNYDISLLERVLKMLAAGEELPAKYRDHALTGNYSSYRECHNIIPFGRRVLNA